MAEKRFKLLFVLILFQLLQNTLCDDDDYNPFSAEKNSKTETDNSEFSKDKIFVNNKEPLEKKVIEKRRLFFNEPDSNSPVSTERQFQANEYTARRRTTNISVAENENRMPEQQIEFNNWSNGKNRFPFAMQPMNMNFQGPQFPVQMQPVNVNLPNDGNRQFFMEQSNPNNQKMNWEKKTEVIEITQPEWNEPQNLQHFSRPEPNPMVRMQGNNNFNVRPIPVPVNNQPMNAYVDNRNADIYSQRVTMTSINEADLGNKQNYDHERMQAYPDIVGTYKKNYFSRTPSAFWNPDFSKPEKGVIINFNTQQCPSERQFNNEMVHKLIYAQKPSVLNSQGQVVSFQVPENPMASSCKVSPIYYC